jgi:Fe-Mn family superoxide dismutase
MKATIGELPYAYDALEPYIDARTMEIHYSKHHATYVSKFNETVEGRTDLEGESLEQLLGGHSSLPAQIRQAVINHGGGHVNHTLFWRNMGPNKGGEPSGDLAGAISGTFGSFDSFKEQFTKTALSRFGSGWAWLTLDPEDGLQVGSTGNQDSPLMFGSIPILGLDVWEHAYYLKYQNRRPEYVQAWWNVVDWDEVGLLFNEARQTASVHLVGSPSK